MSTTWTIEQVLALSPDVRTRHASQRLAAAGAWLSFGYTARVAWGESPGKQPNCPFQTQIDLTEPAFRCTCANRRLPCEHSLALFILVIDETAVAPAHAHPPDWVTQQQDPLYIANALSQAERTSERYAKILTGMQALEQWLEDLVRNGLASTQHYAYSFWEDAAARMVDAEAEEVAKTLRDMAGLPATGRADWPERLLAHIGRLYLLTQGFHHYATLPSPIQADLRTAVGWTPDPAELHNQPVWHDQWLVMGQRLRKDEQIKIQHTWLWSPQYHRPALIIDYAVGDRPISNHFVPGRMIDADVVYYPSTAPLRALVTQQYGRSTLLNAITGFINIASAQAGYAEAIATNPWLPVYPLTLARVIPRQEEARWLLQDPDGYVLPIVASFQQGWHLQALSGGRPLTVFGEWDGEYLTPLSICADGRWLQVNQLRGVS